MPTVNFESFTTQELLRWYDPGTSDEFTKALVRRLVEYHAQLEDASHRLLRLEDELLNSAFLSPFDSLTTTVREISESVSP